MNIILQSAKIFLLFSVSGPYYRIDLRLRGHTFLREFSQNHFGRSYGEQMEFMITNSVETLVTLSLYNVQKSSSMEEMSGPVCFNFAPPVIEEVPLPPTTILTYLADRKSGGKNKNFSGKGNMTGPPLMGVGGG